jgi:protein kinase A
MSRGHDWSADHWSFGVLIYEMLIGLGPFYREGMDQMTLFQRIVEVEYDEPEGVSALAKDIIGKLLQKEPLQRLGSLSGGEEDILQHPWFSGLDLSVMRARQAKAPWVPNVKDPLDTSCFDNWDDLVDKMTEDIPPLRPKDAALFKNF